jgi:hypothetical protein
MIIVLIGAMHSREEVSCCLYRSNLRRMTMRRTVCEHGSEVRRRKERLLKGQRESNVTKIKMKASPAQQRPLQVLCTVFDFQPESSVVAGRRFVVEQLRDVQ